MDSKASALLIFAVFLISTTTTTVTAFNITKLLDRYPDFSSFNGLLTATDLYKQINARRTITVLAISNSNIGALTSKPEDFIKRILSIHVILDYYDGEKLSDLSKKSTILTTLYQSTGVADNQQGFLNVTKSGGQVVFATASHKGANATNATLVGVVAAQPYNISVVEVSGPIIPAGMDVMNVSNPVLLPPVQAPAPKAAKPPRRAPPPDVEVVDAPTDSPADSPADAPVADVPISSPPAPAADGPDAPAPAKSSSSHVAHSVVGLAVVVGALLSLFA